MQLCWFGSSHIEGNSCVVTGRSSAQQPHCQQLALFNLYVRHRRVQSRFETGAGPHERQLRPCWTCQTALQQVLGSTLIVRYKVSRENSVNWQTTEQREAGWPADCRLRHHLGQFKLGYSTETIARLQIMINTMNFKHCSHHGLQTLQPPRT
jgi:hypothetical protein